MIKQLSVAMFGLLLSFSASADMLEGIVVGVSDGDTLTVLSQDKQQSKIRLAQIDAPEKNQDYGQVSKQSLSDMTYKKQAVIEYKEKDKYGRVVGKVLVDGVDVNLEQVKKGLAWVYRQYADDQAYYVAEDSAKAQKINIWSMLNPVAPWDFRHGKATDITPAPASMGAVEDKRSSVAKPISSGGFACGGKSVCGDMSSCAEARFYLSECGLSKLDRDHDGIPCESICK